MRILIDVDGVIARFTKSVCELFNHPYEEPKEFEIHKMLGVSKSYFWKIIDKQGYEFWANIEPYSYFDELIKEIRIIDKDFCLLTSPSLSPDCIKGKLLWIQKHFGRGFRNYIFAPANHKKQLSMPGRILIDDRKQTIYGWNEMGGRGILFPQPYNSSFVPSEDEIVSYISEEISLYI